MRVVDLIRRKRDGGELTPQEISDLIAGYTAEAIPDYQMAAWLMTVLWRGMTKAELAALTEAMLHSGTCLDFSDLPAPKVDKHSTGGVGDKTSLVLAPVVAAAGLYVPMISGRGLGHTGGTLDKLESIPGFSTALTLERFREVLASCGCAMIGQTADVAPADKRIYALRDVTGTVESPYLICASIMSKKLAEGIDALVLDVKTGSGAFMKTEQDAAFLAQLMVETGERMGKSVVALLTDMDQPLGRNIGNALEVAECIEVLRGGGPDDLRRLCVELSAWILLLGRRAATLEEGARRAEALLSGGQALEKLRIMVGMQGGDERVLDDPRRLPQAKNRSELGSPAAGHVAAMDCEKFGVASCVLGGGREKKEDSVDPAVGIVLQKKTGDAVKTGELLCTLHYNSATRLDEARALLAAGYQIAPGDAPASLKQRTLVRRVIGRPGN